jgi:hypothetical protein
MMLDINNYCIHKYVWISFDEATCFMALDEGHVGCVGEIVTWNSDGYTDFQMDIHVSLLPGNHHPSQLMLGNWGIASCDHSD